MNRPEVRRLMEREPSRLAARQRRETRASASFRTCCGPGRSALPSRAVH